MTKRNKTHDSTMEDLAQWLDVAEIILVALDRNGNVSLMNRKGAEVLGYEQQEIIGRDWFESFLPAAVRNDVAGVFGKIMNGDIGPVEYHENPVLTRSGEERLIAWHNGVVRDRTGHITASISSGQDITERRSVERELQERAAENRLLIENSPYCIHRADTEGHIISMNPAGLRMIGVRNEADIVGRACLEIVSPKDRETIRQILSDVAGGKTAEFEFQAANGRFFQSVLVPLAGSDGHVSSLMGLTLDITRRIGQERERQFMSDRLQDLSGRLMYAQEDERRRISGELHDDFGQRLALINVEIDRLCQGSSASSVGLGQRLQALGQEVRELSADVRHLSHRLHPQKLEYLGLSAALSSLCREFSKQYGIDVRFCDREAFSVPKTVALALYRVAQEALRNVVQHSGARKARVELLGSVDSIRLLISDQGTGFDLREGETKGLGLINMQERLRLVGGQISIRTQRGTGTRIEAQVVIAVPLAQGGGTTIPETEREGDETR